MSDQVIGRWLREAAGAPIPSLPASTTVPGWRRWLRAVLRLVRAA